MNERNNIVCPEAYAALKVGVEAGLKIVREHEAGGNYILNYSGFPEMGYFDSGLPRFSKTSWFDKNGPFDYTSVFRDDKREDSIPQWRPFAELAKSHPRLKVYYDVSRMFRADAEGVEEFRREIEHRSILRTASQMVDCYIHATKSKVFDDELFYPVYKKWENAAFSERVGFDIVCPLLMLKFDFDNLDIGEDRRVERMTDDFQLSRSIQDSGFFATNDIVTGAARIALYLQNWSLQHDSYNDRVESLSNVEAFRDAIHRIDYFFSALRAVTGVDTGYSQIIVRPDGWADGWHKAHLPQVNVIHLRAYPDQFENYGWLRTPPTISREACNEVGALYNALLTLNKNQLSLAARRLNMALLRNSEQDSILDVTIGLETLLVPDGGNGEITHKLALRLAAISRMRQFESYQPPEVFGLCKKLYDYRSAVAHGAGDLEKKRVIHVGAEKQPIPTIGIGTALLRYALRFLAEKPEYLNAKALDMTLLAETESAPPV